MKYFLLGFGLLYFLSVKAEIGERRPFYEIGIYENSGSQMTNLMRDSLLFQKDTIVIDESPLLVIEGLSKILFQKGEALSEELKTIRYIPKMNVHFGDRGYIARWKIKNYRLYLNDIHPNVMGSQPKIKPDQFRSRLEKGLGKRFGRSGLIFADWFTGTLVGGIGGSLNQYGIAGNFKKKIEIRVKNGKILDFSVMDVEKRDSTLFEYLLPGADDPGRLPYYYYRIYPSGRVTTNLKRDCLSVGNDTMYINESPLLDLKGLESFFCMPEDSVYGMSFDDNPFEWCMKTDHNDRGFWASWGIVGDRLYLERIRIYGTRSYWGWEASGEGGKHPFLEVLERVSGEKLVDGRLFARWFTGRIVGGIEEDGRICEGIGGNFKREIILMVKNGIVENIEIKPVVHRESRLVQYRLPDE